jgi:hypothetical protein
VSVRREVPVQSLAPPRHHLLCPTALSRSCVHENRFGAPLSQARILAARLEGFEGTSNVLCHVLKDSHPTAIYSAALEGLQQSRERVLLVHAHLNCEHLTLRQMALQLRRILVLSRGVQ